MAWLTGWTYRKEITVSNASADYQTKVLIGKTADAVGEDVDCGGNIADDFDDLRFTAADGTTLLDYWIEQIVDSGGTKLATVWVQNNATPDTTLYMYYSGTETAVSNGANTFIQFEDFEWGSEDDSLGDDGGSIDWTVAAGDADISTDQAFGGTRSGRLSEAGAASIARVSQAPSNDVAIRFRLYKSDASLPRFYYSSVSPTWILYWHITADESIYYYDGANKDTGVNAVINTWELYEVNNINFTAGTYDLYRNGVRIGDDIGMWNSAGGDNAQVYSVTGVCYFDDFIIRKWAATEPSFAFGSEETEGVDYDESFSVGLTIAPTIAISVDWTRSFSEVLNITETITRSVAWGRAANLALTIAETVSTVTAYIISFSESLTISPTFARTVSFARSFNKGLTIAETVVASFTEFVRKFISVIATLTSRSLSANTKDRSYDASIASKSSDATLADRSIDATQSDRSYDATMETEV